MSLLTAIDPPRSVRDERCGPLFLSSSPSAVTLMDLFDGGRGGRSLAPMFFGLCAQQARLLFLDMTETDLQSTRCL